MSEEYIKQLVPEPGDYYEHKSEEIRGDSVWTKFAGFIDTVSSLPDMSGASDFQNIYDPTAPENVNKEKAREYADTLSKGISKGWNKNFLLSEARNGVGYLNPEDDMSTYMDMVQKPVMRTKQELMNSPVWTRAREDVKNEIKINEEGDTEEALKLLIENKTEELDAKNAMKALPIPEWQKTAAEIEAGIKTSLTDPAEWAINLAVPGEAILAKIAPRAAAWMMERAATSVGARVLQRTAAGAIEGEVGAIISEPLIYLSSNNAQEDYTMWDSINNLVFAPVVGATMRNSFGAIGDAMGFSKTTQAELARRGLRDIFEDEFPSLERNLDELRESRPFVMGDEGEDRRFTMGDERQDGKVDGAVKDAEPDSEFIRQENERMKASTEANEKPKEQPKPKPEEEDTGFREPTAEEEDAVYGRGTLRTPILQMLADTVKGFKDMWERLDINRGNHELRLFRLMYDTENLHHTINPPSEELVGATVEALDNLKLTDEVRTKLNEQLDTITKSPSQQSYDKLYETIKELGTNKAISKEQFDAIAKINSQLHADRAMSSSAYDRLKSVMENSRIDKVRTTALEETGNILATQNKYRFDYANEGFIEKTTNTVNNSLPENVAKYTKSEVREILKQLQHNADFYYNQLTHGQEVAKGADEMYRRAAYHLAAQKTHNDALRNESVRLSSAFLREIRKIEARKYILDFVKNNPKASLADAYYAYMATDYLTVQFWKAGKKDVRVSSDLKMEGHSSRMLSTLYADLEKEGLLQICLKNEQCEIKGRKLSHDEFERDLVKELWNVDHGLKNSTGNNKARNAAEILQKLSDYSLDAQNERGSFIDKLPGRLTQQTHDADRIAGPPIWSKIKNIGRYDKYLERMRSQWIEFIKPLLDADKTFGSSNPDEWLASAWNHIVSGDGDIRGSYATQSYTPDTSRYGNKIQYHRKLHFATPEAWLEYNKKYGRQDFFSSFVADIDRAGKNMGLLETHGPDPYSFHQDMKAWIKGETERRRGLGEAVQFSPSDEPRLDRIFHELTGELDAPQNRAWSRAGSNIRAVLNFRFLNNVIYSTLGDWVNGSDTLRRAGVGFLDRVYSSYVKNGVFSFLTRLPNLPHDLSRGSITGIANANRANTSLAIKLGIDVVMESALNRYALADNPGRKLQWLSDKYFRLNMLQGHDQDVKTGFLKSIANVLAKIAGAEWDGIDLANSLTGKVDTTKLTTELARYGIGPDEWNIIRRGITEVDGQQYITPYSVGKLSDDQVLEALGITKFTPGANAAVSREKAALALQMFYYDEMRAAVPTPGAAQRARAKLGTQSGTALGELGKFFFQYKMFTFTMLFRTFMREVQANDGKFPAMRGFSTLLISSASTMMTLGLLSNVLAALGQGKDPVAEMKNAFYEAWNLNQYGKAADTFLLDPLGRTAGFGTLSEIFQKFREGKMFDFATEAGGKFAGPAGKSLVEIITTIGDWASNQAMKDVSKPDKTSKLLETGTKYLPMVNLPYTKPLIELLITDHLHEAINPGYRERQMIRNSRKYGTEYMWGPLAGSPSKPFQEQEQDSSTELQKKYSPDTVKTLEKLKALGL